MHPKKQAICEVALQLLSSPSENSRFTLQAIADQLNIGKSTIYEYFENKVQIIEASLIYLIDQQFETLFNDDSILEKPFEIAFKTHYQKVLDVNKENQSLQTLMMHSDVAQLPQENKENLLRKMHQSFVKTEKRLQDILAIGIKEKILDSPIEATQFHCIESLIFGSIIALAQPYNMWDHAQMIEAVYQNVIKLHNKT